MALAGAVLFTLAPAAVSPVEAAKPKTEAQQIIKIAKAQIGDPWRYGARGPRAFDCSGLVIYAFTKAGDAKAVGNGKLRSARALYRYYKARGLASRSNPKVGDLVIWGGGTHVGIYIGKGKAISTLTSGVRIHGVHAVRAPFTAYLHTGMSKKLTAAGKAAKAEATAAKLRANSVRTVALGDTVQADGRITLRTAPGSASSSVATVANDAKLVVLGAGQDTVKTWWLKVQAGEHIGWVAKWATD
jgi:hypothetical protein